MWFRKYNKEFLIFTDRIASTDYLYTVITKKAEATIYYYNVSPYLNFDEVLKYYANTKVVLKKIAFKQSENVQYKTRKDYIAASVLAKRDLMKKTLIR